MMISLFNQNKRKVLYNMSGGHKKKTRQVSALERTKASIQTYKKKLGGTKDIDEKKWFQDKIRKAKTVIANLEAKGITLPTT